MRSPHLLSAGAWMAAAALMAVPACAQCGPPQGWSIGLGVIGSSEVHAGEGTQTVVVPLISYEGERLYWRGVAGGLRLLPRGDWDLDITLGVRLDGMEVGDLGRASLARNGIDRDRLEDRDIGADLGLRVEWDSPVGDIGAHLKTDISGRSGGQELALRYGLPMPWNRTRLTPYLQASHWSGKLANHVYGTLPGEVARGVPPYEPGAVKFFSLGLDVDQRLGAAWALRAGLSITRLPTAVRDSPLVEPGTRRKTSLLLAVSRQL
jgi:MipA family protein